MQIPVFQILNYTLILVVLILFIRYLWDMFFDREYQPAAWQVAKKTGRLSRQVVQMERHFPDKVRFFNWWFQIERLTREKIPGDFAELGVYKGESARILHHMDPGRKLHLFDTFEGFNRKDLRKETGAAATYTENDFADTNILRVIKRIKGNANLVIHKGYFPETVSGLEHERFALVNIDCDLYNPTRAGLEFFYPRLTPGGVILIHDYNPKWQGVVEAVDEFMRQIPEPLMILPDMEGTVMIIRGK